MKPIKQKGDFLFGCDPELFLQTDKGEFISAAGLLPGTKAEPFPVDKGGVQVDGMAAEITIDPASTYEEWETNLTTVLAELERLLPKGVKAVDLPYVRFSPEVFDAAPEEAKILGCDPDYNAWSKTINPKPDTSADPYLRTAAGHVHIGWGKDIPIDHPDHIEHCHALVRQLDWYLGGWSCNHDPDTTRRRLYGDAGACRYKPYGVEYRVLSNFWVKSPSLRLGVWNRMNQAILDMPTCNLGDEVAPAVSFRLINGIKQGIIPADIATVYHRPLLSL